MTVKLLSAWGAQPAGTLFSGTAETEAAMIAAKVATATVTGGTSWPVASPPTDVQAVARGLSTGPFQLFAGGLPLYTAPAQNRRLVTVACGNSIPGYNAYTFADKLFASTAELHFANQLAGAPMLFREIAAGTRVDAFGIHSFGGQQVPAIITDITTASTGWFALLAAGGTIPDMVCIPDAIVNDVAADVDAETCKVRLAQLINVIRARWPNVIVWLDTIRGNALFTQGTTRRMIADSVCDWMLTLDDGRNTFVTDVRGAWGDMAAGITQFSPDGTHPNPRGAMAVGRLKAETLRRISAVNCGNTAVNSNPWLLGSIAATGTGVSGTISTGAFHALQAGPSTVVCTALNPGQRLQYTLSADADVGDYNTAGNAVASDLAPGTRVAMNARVRLISGAEFVRCVRPRLRIYYTAATGGGSDFRNGMRFESANNAVYPIYKDGDVLDVNVPACFGTPAKNIESLQPFIRVECVGGSKVVAEIDYMNASVLA